MENLELSYEEEDDMLEVFWSKPNRDEMAGFELEENIVLHTDRSLSKPVRLMLFAYSQLIKESCIELTNLPLLPPEKQERVRLLLKQYPLNRFLFFDGENSVKVASAIELAPAT